jgi:hypothetical protein
MLDCGFGGGKRSRKTGKFGTIQGEFILQLINLWRFTSNEWGYLSLGSFFNCSLALDVAEIIAELRASHLALSLRNCFSI